MSLDPTRLRRLRRTSALRAMVNETALRPTDLIMPIFAGAGGDRRAGCDPRSTPLVRAAETAPARASAAS